MKINITLLLSFLLAAASTIAQDTPEEIQRIMVHYHSILLDEGYSPSFDSDNDIKFKVEGSSYFIIRQDYANAFSMSRYFNNDEGCSNKIYAVANYVSKNSRWAKATINDDCSTFIIRVNLVANWGNHEDLITRGISAIKYAKRKMSEKYDELSADE
jgi:hypothetical protein